MSENCSSTDLCLASIMYSCINFSEIFPSTELDIHFISVSLLSTPLTVSEDICPVNSTVIATGWNSLFYFIFFL